MYYIFSSQLLNDSLCLLYHAYYPWYNNDLEAMKRKLRRFEKIYNKTNSEFNYNNLNTIRK